MQTIDVHDLPEDMARAIAQTVEHLRAQVNRPAATAANLPPRWSLGVRDRLTREDIYDHLDE